MQKSRRTRRYRPNGQKKQTKKQSVFEHPYVQKQSWNRHTNKRPVWRRFVGGRREHAYHISQDGRRIQTIPTDPASLTRSDGFVFLVDAEDENAYIAIPRNDGEPCFKIDFDVDRKTISISIANNPRCSYNRDLPESEGTLIMLLTALNIIMRHPTIRNYSCITLDDQSTKKVRSPNKADHTLYDVDLMDMYYVCTGCTWYSSLAPMWLMNGDMETHMLRDREAIVGRSAISWGSFLQHVPKEHADGFRAIQPAADDTEPASTVLNRIRKERTHSIIFQRQRYLPSIFRAMEISFTTLRGLQWCILIQDGKIVGCKEDPMYACKNEKGWLIPETMMVWTSEEDYAERKDEIRRLHNVATEEAALWYDTIREEGRLYNPTDSPISNNLESIRSVGSDWDPDNIQSIIRR